MQDQGNKAATTTKLDTFLVPENEISPVVLIRKIVYQVPSTKMNAAVKDHFLFWSTNLPYIKKVVCFAMFIYKNCVLV